MNRRELQHAITMLLFILATTLIIASVLILVSISLSKDDLWTAHYKPEPNRVLVDWGTLSSDVWAVDVHPMLVVMETVVEAEEMIVEMFGLLLEKDNYFLQISIYWHYCLKLYSL